MARHILAATAILGFLTLISCSKLKNTTPTASEERLYIGSQACRTCHSSIYSDFVNTGHAHSLNRVMAGTAPVYPDSVPALADPPFGYTWSDVTYVIGGFGWKADFIDSQGYIVTGDAAQWNLETAEWAAFDSSTAPGTRAFDCGACHTTGYDSRNPDNLPGIVGSWAENGVGCERCHGPGSQHALNPRDHRMQVDDTAQLCGECHHRSGDHRILAYGDLLQNYQQYDELLSAGHGNLRCVTCHNPHRSAKYDAGNAIISACTDCHTITVTHDGPHDCINCHMPKSVESAVSSGNGIHLRGDMRSHIFRINPDINEDQFYVDGSNQYSNGFNGLNFACLSSCHQSGSLSWAAQNAPGIHQ